MQTVGAQPKRSSWQMKGPWMNFKQVKIRGRFLHFIWLCVITIQPYREGGFYYIPETVRWDSQPEIRKEREMLPALWTDGHKDIRHQTRFIFLPWDSAQWQEWSLCDGKERALNWGECSEDSIWEEPHEERNERVLESGLKRKRKGNQPRKDIMLSVIFLKNKSTLWFP